MTIPCGWWVQFALTSSYRQDTFRDMMNNPAIARMFHKLIPVLTDIMELRRLEADSGNTSDYLSSLTEIELYISSIEIPPAKAVITRL